MRSTSAVTMKSIGVMSVATNIYLDYWKDLVLSADTWTNSDDEVTFHVFTDNPDEAKKFGQNLKNVKIKAFTIPPHGWPEATLLRYSIFKEYADQLQSDVLVHLDADMLIVANPWERLRKNLINDTICLVEHPGYWRPGFKFQSNLYLKKPIKLITDFWNLLQHGGLGAWENNKLSKAYVPRNERRKYFCGATWFGNRDAIMSLIKELSNNVAIDIDNLVMAQWHDESHLNYWASRNKPRIESPELCFDETYSHLSKLAPYIIAVRKKDKTR